MAAKPNIVKDAIDILNSINAKISGYRHEPNSEFGDTIVLDLNHGEYQTEH